jgi:enamine deaminase RidA (YjgF/YER057c/UK114 family)
MDRERLEPSGHWTWRGGPAWGPIAQGWRVGNTVYVGGQVAVDEHGQVIAPGDIETQTRECYRNIENVLARAGGSLQDVVKITSFLVWPGEPAGPEFDDFWVRMATVRASFFPGDGPCGTGVIVKALIYPGLVIEVEAIAVLSAAASEGRAEAV